MIDVMHKLDNTLDYLLPEKLEQPRVIEPPLGNMSRIHELMGNPEKRDELRVRWQLSDEEMLQMGEVFVEIAKLHDLLRPEDIKTVLEKRTQGMTKEIWESLFTVIHRVRQQNTSSSLSPMPPDNGGNFGDEISGFIHILDAKDIGTLPDEKFITMMREGLRKTYAAKELEARESVEKEVISKIQVEFNLNKAWRVVRNAYDVAEIDAEEEVELRRALLLIGEDKRSDWSDIEIREQVEQNIRAIKARGVGNEQSPRINKKNILIGKELASTPDSTETTLDRCRQIVDSYIARKELILDQETMGGLDAKLARLFENEMFQPIKDGTLHVDGDIFQPLFEKAVDKAKSRLDDIVRKSVKAIGLRNRLVPYINDPPKRREAMLEWQKFVNGLLRNRLKEVRLAPITEALITHVINGGTIDTLAADMPETNQRVERLLDMAKESGHNLDGRDDKTILGIVEWLQQL